MKNKKNNRTVQPCAATAEPQNSAVLECRFCRARVAGGMDEMPCQNCRSDEIYRFLPVGTPRNYVEIQKQFGFKDHQIAAVFGLAPHDFKTSSAKARYKKAVERLYYLFFVFHG